MAVIAIVTRFDLKHAYIYWICWYNFWKLLPQTGVDTHGKTDVGTNEDTGEGANKGVDVEEDCGDY